MTRRLLPELEARRHLLEPYGSFPEIPADVVARWKAPYGPPESWDLQIYDTRFDGPHGPVPARVYVPTTARPTRGRPALVWMHGGAFAWGDLDMPEAHEAARGIAGRADAVVVSVDYRLCRPPGAPGGATGDLVDERGEQRGEPVSFPVPHDDCVAAFEAVRHHASGLGIDPGRIAIGGASAGGCLAAGVALRLADDGRPPWQMLLVYPVLHPVLPEPSAELAEALAAAPTALELPRTMRDAIDRGYLGGKAPTRYAYAGLAEDLTACPDAYVETGEFDMLRSSGQAFAEQLRVAGVDVEEHVRAGVPHGHLDLVGLRAAAETLDALARRLGRP